jgi:hypothetical protein
MATAKQKAATEQTAKQQAESAEQQAEAQAETEPGTVEKVPGLRVTTKIEGFRRGGRKWHGTTDVTLDQFNEAQLRQIKGESKFVVQEIEVEK